MSKNYCLLRLCIILENALKRDKRIDIYQAAPRFFGLFEEKTIKNEKKL